jgi:hypothetical protein
MYIGTPMVLSRPDFPQSVVKLCSVRHQSPFWSVHVVSVSLRWHGHSQFASREHVRSLNRRIVKWKESPKDKRFFADLRHVRGSQPAAAAILVLRGIKWQGGGRWLRTILLPSPVAGLGTSSIRRGGSTAEAPSGSAIGLRAQRGVGRHCSGCGVECAHVHDCEQRRVRDCRSSMRWSS